MTPQPNTNTRALLLPARGQAGGGVSSSLPAASAVSPALTHGTGTTGGGAADLPPPSMRFDMIDYTQDDSGAEARHRETDHRRQDRGA